MKRLLIVLTVGALALSAVSPAAARQPTTGATATPLTATSVIHGSKSMSGRLAQSDKDLLARTDSALVNVMVKMDLDAVASYQGDLNNMQATSPYVTGRPLKDNPSAVTLYSKYLSTRANTVRSAVQRAVPAAKLGATFLIAYGGFAAQIPANQAKNLLKIKGVSAVQKDDLAQPTALDSPIFVGATQVWPSLGGSLTAGKGIKIGSIDTGIWPEHPMLLDPGIPAPPPGAAPFACEFGLSGDPNDPAFTCNDKLAGAYAFTDSYMQFVGDGPGEFCDSSLTSPAHPYGTCSARDSEGHGTHTATTAAGSRVNSAVLLGVDRGPISGIAPGASVIAYRVCLEQGCFSSDSVNAVQQAITDDVDVINFSISGGENPYSDAVELAFLDAYAAGISVNASAGNSGPAAATVAHGGPWVNTIGASTLDRSFESTLHLTASGGATLNVTGVTITAGITTPTPVVSAASAPYSDALCTTPAASGTFTGKVVLCKRGGSARVDKGYNVLQGGAAGMILYNASAASTDLESDNHWLPAIHVQYDGGAIATFLSTHTGVMATWAGGTATPAQGDVMASFSSRGPLGDFIKPDVTAPGIQILAGHSPKHTGISNGPENELYQAIAGTSMSSPHAAGVAILLKAAHPSWTPGQIKSAMLTSAAQDVVKEDGVTPADPFDDGGGSIRANRAIKPTVTFDVNPVDFYASAGDPFARVDLNLASIDAPNMPGIITTTRTARNVTNTSQTLDITTTAPAGASITVTPSKLVIPAFGSATFQVTIKGLKLDDGWYFGEIKLNPEKSGYLDALMPVAFDKGPGVVTLSNSCDATTLTVGDTTGCEVNVTNLSPDTAHVSVSVKAPNTGRLILKNWSAGNKTGNGFQWNGTLTPALAPEILGMHQCVPADNCGFLSLSTFGVPLDTSYGDEDIKNYGTDTFSFGGELYNQVGVDSNGYVVVGGSTSAADNNCCNPAMPDPAAPNNVLAPYWTDLDPSKAGGLRVAELACGGIPCYLIVEWDAVPVFGTTNYRTFQVWIQLDAISSGDEYIEYDYSQTGAGASTGLLVGAENRDGSSAATIGPLNTVPSTSGYIVEAGTPTPGGSMTITYDAFGKKTGTNKITAKLTSDVTQGTATKVVTIHVIP